MNHRDEPYDFAAALTVYASAVPDILAQQGPAAAIDWLQDVLWSRLGDARASLQSIRHPDADPREINPMLDVIAVSLKTTWDVVTLFDLVRAHLPAPDGS